MTRRCFVGSTLAAGLAAPSASAARPKRIAAIMTVLWEGSRASHARSILGKCLHGYDYDDKSPKPDFEIASMFTHQTPENDLSRRWGREAGIPVYETVYEALTLGGKELAVDGVLLIGEHGDYPWNEKGQHLYPRYELFLEITDAFRATGRSAPVFNDKHLSWSWVQAQRMVALSRELDFPFMAGSSIPVMYREPEIEVPLGAPVKHAVALGWGNRDSYGFHLLETVQCFVERRKGGETGVRAVQAFDGEDVWRFLDRTPWAQRLFDAALAASQTREPGNVRELVKDPGVFVVEHNDGIQTATFVIPGAFHDFNVAIEIEGRAEPLASMLWTSDENKTNFTCLLKAIEPMFKTGKPTYPVERTLLVTGALHFAMESRFQGYRRLETPQLDVAYQVSGESFHCKK
ncbi:MAG: hypothetical protein GC160_13325 [Acidobacteria bacterium]|nr:hypothetical protein [Acidobacteriota bacterium]